ncbi:MAG: 50S ribosomal protein L13 [Mycobacteriales bacterium]
MRTYTPKPGDIEHRWHVIDATDVILGQLASSAARLLRGKHKATYTPNVDVGDYVVIINAEKLVLTGNKLRDKMVYRHSGYPGGLKSVPIGVLLARRPERVVENAIKGMLPKTSLGRMMFGKLKVYAGPVHPHAAQQPAPFQITQMTQIVQEKAAA